MRVVEPGGGPRPSRVVNEARTGGPVADVGGGGRRRVSLPGMKARIGNGP